MNEKAVLIDWVDSASTSGWQKKEDCKAVLLSCRSIGFLVNETKEVLNIALNKAISKNFAPYGDLISIPKVAIKKIKRINLK